MSKRRQQGWGHSIEDDEVLTPEDDQWYTELEKFLADVEVDDAKSSGAIVWCANCSTRHRFDEACAVTAEGVIVPVTSVPTSVQKMHDKLTGGKKGKATTKVCAPGCNGPGSPTEKFTSHLPKCPLYEGYKASSWTKSCSHAMAPVALLEGSLFASAWRDVPWNRESKDIAAPDLGVYLYEGWVRGMSLASPGLEVPWASAAPFPFVYFVWPDYQAPENFDQACLLVLWVLEQVAAGKKVEVGCMGGHGRTGTLLAALRTAQGELPGRAVGWVRVNYCKSAVESNKQIDFVADVYKEIHGNDDWRQVRKERKYFNSQRKWESKKGVKAIVSGTIDNYKPKTCANEGCEQTVYNQDAHNTYCKVLNEAVMKGGD